MDLTESVEKLDEKGHTIPSPMTGAPIRAMGYQRASMRALAPKGDNLPTTPSSPAPMRTSRGKGEVVPLDIAIRAHGHEVP